MENLINEKELSTLLNLSVAWCQRARCYGGGPPFIKLGRSVRYRMTEVINWLSKCPSHANTINIEGGEL